LRLNRFLSRKGLPFRLAPHLIFSNSGDPLPVLCLIIPFPPFFGLHRLRRRFASAFVAFAMSTEVHCCFPRSPQCCQNRGLTLRIPGPERPHAPASPSIFFFMRRGKRGPPDPTAWSNDFPTQPVISQCFCRSFQSG